MLSQYINKIFIGVCYGVSFPLTITVLDYWLKDLGVSNTLIGLFSFIHWPFMLKFLWSPIVEHFDVPILSKRFSRYKSWLIASYILLIVGILIMAYSNPESSIIMLIGGASLVAIADGCKNIVLYPYQILDKQELSIGFIASCVNFGNRIGSIFIKVATLYVADYLNWRFAYLFAASILFIVMSFTLFIKEPQNNEQSEGFSFKYIYFKSLIEPMKQFIKIPDSKQIMFIICMYKSADFIMQKMSKMFCIEVGFSKLEIANIVQLYGSITVIIGSFVGGYFIKKLGIIKSMSVILCIHAVSFLSYLLLLEFGKDNGILTLIITMEALSGGAVTSCFLAFFYVNAANLPLYAVLWAIYEFSGLIFMSLSGITAQLLGWTGFFCIVPLFVIPNLIVLSSMRVDLQESPTETSVTGNKCK